MDRQCALGVGSSTANRPVLRTSFGRNVEESETGTESVCSGPGSLVLFPLPMLLLGFTKVWALRIEYVIEVPRMVRAAKRKTQRASLPFGTVLFCPLHPITTAETSVAGNDAIAALCQQDASLYQGSDPD